MKKYLSALVALLFGGVAMATNYQSIASKDLQDPTYLFKRTDDPQLKSYLATSFLNNQHKVGVVDLTTSAYGTGVTGTYDLVDANTGSILTVPAGSLVTDVKVYVPTAVTSVGSVTAAVGFSGSNAALLAATSSTALTAAAVLQGVPSGASSTVVRTADTPLNFTLTGTTAASTGKIYVLLRTLSGLN